MLYFDDLAFRQWAYVPDCQGSIDRAFPDYWGLNFCAAGRVDFAVDQGRSVALTAPAMWWTWPGQPFRYRAARGIRWNHYFVTFSGVRAQSMMTGGLLPPGRRPYILVEDPIDVTRRWQKLLQTLDSPEERHAEAVHELEGLLLLIRANHRQHHAGRHRSQIELLACRIEDGFSTDLRMAEQAADIGLSESQLRRLFTARYGISPYGYLTSLRLARACSMLRFGSGSIKEVAAAVGVPDVYYFSRLFRKRFGRPPTAYRREAREILSLQASSNDGV